MNLRRLATYAALLAVTLAPLILTTPASSANYSCINNDCPVKTSGIVYGGGPLITAPNVYLVRFSSSSSDLSPSSGYLPQDFSSSAPNLAGAINDVLDNPQTSWWQHAYSEPNYQLGFGSYTKTITITNPTLATASSVTTNELTNAVTDDLGNGSLPDITPNAVYDVVLRSSQKLDGGLCYTWAQSQAYNSADNVVDVPFFSVSSTKACTSSFASGLSSFENETSWTSKLLVDSALDPGLTFPGAAGWVNANTGVNLTDVCLSGKSPTALTTYQGQKYTIARVWSEQIHGCIASALTPSITAAYISATQVSVDVSAQGLPLANRYVTISVGNNTVAFGETIANGTDIITIPAEPASSIVTATVLTSTAPAPYTVYGLLSESAGVVPASAGRLTINAPASVEAGRHYTITMSITPPASTIVSVSGPGLHVKVPLNAAGRGKFTLSSPLGTDKYTFSASLFSSTTVTVRGLHPPTLKLVAISPRNVRATLTDPGPVANAPLTFTPNGGKPFTVHTDNKGQVSVLFPDGTGTRVTVRYAGTSELLPATSAITIAKNT